MPFEVASTGDVLPVTSERVTLDVVSFLNDSVSEGSVWVIEVMLR